MWDIVRLLPYHFSVVFYDHSTSGHGKKGIHYKLHIFITFFIIFRKSIETGYFIFSLYIFIYHAVIQKLANWSQTSCVTKESCGKINNFFVLVKSCGSDLRNQLHFCGSAELWLWSLKPHAVENNIGYLSILHCSLSQDSGCHISSTLRAWTVKDNHGKF